MLNKAAMLIWRVLRLFLLAYLLVILLFTFLERSLVYPVPSLDRSDWQPEGLEFEEVHFASTDGTKLHGWYFDHPLPERAILYCHGNGEQVADNGELMDLLREQLDASVFVFDYRGYGHSQGKPDEQGLIQDGIAAQNWLAEKTARKPEEIVIVGRSIGGGVAVALAAELGTEALVLQSTFTRLTDAAATLFPWLPVRLAMKNRFDSMERIKRYNGPLLSSHGTTDLVVPFEQGRQLYEAAPGQPKEFFQIDRSGHNDMQPKSYYPALKRFLEQASKQPSPST